MPTPLKRMKKYIKIFLLLLISFGLKAQTPLPTGLPSPRSTSWYEIGWMQTDSGFINAVRSTSFTPRFVGTQVFQIRAGVDTLPWWWTGQRWITFPTSGGGSGNFNSFSFTNQNGLTGVVTGSTGPNVALALGTNLNGIVKANGSGFGTIVVGSGLAYDGTTLSAGTNINALISGNGTNFIATTIGAGLSYSTVTHTLTNTIVNNNQLINGAGYISNVTGYIQAGTNIAIAGVGTLASPYVISSTGGGSVTGAGNLSPLFTTSVSVGTINFAFTNPAAFTIFGNPTSGSASPVYYGVNSTLVFSGNLLGVNPSAPLNFYQTITQIDSFTFTLNTPTGRHDTVRISLPTNGFISNLNNGLTLTGSLGQLGGPLVQNTLINGGGFYLAIQGNRFATGMGASIAAANNLTTGNDGNLFQVTGLTQINAITSTNWPSGSEISFVFTSTPVLKNNTIGGAGTAPLQLAGSIDYQAAPGDYIKFQYDGSFWHEESRKLASAGGAYIFSNGITESPATRVKLGGTLTQNTTLAGAGTFWFAINGGRFQTGAGAAIVAANNLLPGNDGNQFSVTGNTQINAISTLNWQAGPHIELIFTGTPLLKNNTAGGVNTAVMLLAGSVDYQAAAGDLIGLSYDGTVWHETNRKLAGSVSSGLVTANNGLTANTSSNVQLGGTLIQNTSISAGAFNLSLTGTLVGSLFSTTLSGTNTTGQSKSINVNNSQSGTAFVVGQNFGIDVNVTNGGLINTGIRINATVGTGGGTATGIQATGDTYGVNGNGNFGVYGTPTSGSGQAGVKGDGTLNTVYGVWAVGNVAMFAQSNTGNYAMSGETISTANNTVLGILNLTRDGASAPANGIGGSMDFFTQTTASNQLSNQIISKWTDVTNATRTSQFVITGTTNAVTAAIADMSGTTANFYGSSVGVRAISGSTGGVFQGTVSGVSAASAVTPLAATNISTGSTGSVLSGISVTRQGAFAGAIGEGVSIDFGLNNASSALTASGSIVNKFTVVTAGSESSQFDFKTVSAGAGLTVFSLKPNGVWNAPQVAAWGNFANNAAALAGGLVAGDLYRNGDVVQIVH